MRVESLTLENLITRLSEICGKDNISFSYREGVYHTFIMSSGLGILEEEAVELFSSFKKHYQKLVKKPIIESPGPYILQTFNHIASRVGSFSPYVSIYPIRNDRYELSAIVDGKTVSAVGDNINHALVILLREFEDLEDS